MRAVRIWISGIILASGSVAAVPQAMAQQEGTAPDSTSLERRLSTFAAHTGGTPLKTSGPAACGSCGDPRGPGACSMN